jgi:cytochrome P450
MKVQNAVMDAVKVPTAEDILNKPLDDIDVRGVVHLAEPHEFYRRLREEAPVYRDPRTGLVYVSSYDLVMDVLQRPQAFSNNTADFNRGTAHADQEELDILAQGVPHADILSNADQPLHTVQRKLVMKAFTPVRIEKMESGIAAITNMLIDRLIDSGSCDFKAAFAVRLPAIVMSDMLGVPREHLDRYLSWSDATVVQISGGFVDSETRIAAARKKLEFQQYFLEFIAERRKTPTGDLVSDLVHADLADEGDARQLSDAELVNLIEQLNIAGNETTANTLTVGLYHLITRDDVRAQASQDGKSILKFIDELLRFYSPVAKMPRMVVEDAEIGGVPVHKGEFIFLQYASANRDQSMFDKANELDINRSNARRHLAFASGIHTCLGSHLARKEMAIAFPILLDRLKNLRLTESGSKLRFTPHPLLTSPAGLEISFDRV